MGCAGGFAPGKANGKQEMPSKMKKGTFLKSFDKHRKHRRND